MKVLDLLDNLVRGLAGLCLGAVFVLVTVQVASRFLFNFSFATASELSIYAMIWSVFLGAAVAFRQNLHIAMDFVKNLLPERLIRLANLLIFLCLAIFLCLIVVDGNDLAQRAMRQASPAAGLPVGYVTMAMPICSALSLIFLVENFVTQFRNPPK